MKTSLEPFTGVQPPVRRLVRTRSSILTAD
jgi:hypothetical protein